MTYSKKTLATIGKQVIQKHPDLATAILGEIKPPSCTDLSKIPEHFNSYCQAIGADPESIKGPVYKSSITELKKVFVSAMAVIYSGKWGLRNTLAGILVQNPPYTSRMLNEVRFRYSRDTEFKEKVNAILHKINPLLSSNTNGHDQ